MTSPGREGMVPIWVCLMLPPMPYYVSQGCQPGKGKNTTQDAEERVVVCREGDNGGRQGSLMPGGGHHGDALCDVGVRWCTYQ